MALQPSRPGFMAAGGIVFLLIPFVLASFTNQPVNTVGVIVGVVIALVFFSLALQYRRQLRARADVGPRT
jgi:hypothetical protein